MLKGLLQKKKTLNLKMLLIVVVYKVWSVEKLDGKNL
jgi:hypothetical protein